ncbi:MAG: 2-oxoacid:acceptor oxidoreductase family protein [Deltaproteobacteria bacterium]|jgi:2-oxoglutarate ferredoxin oxidoreductase subunit gamma|nr:2-oxoacid:acceptor oxidoreductase family protein [Deltaproteobacteria bacterium]
MSLVQLTFAGIGGQGSILAGTILGNAAVTYGGRYATQTQAYSSELRGGFAATWVIFSDEPIVYPRVVQPDILVAQAQDSIDRFAKTLKKDGILLVDSDIVQSVPSIQARRYRIAATSLARNEFSAPIVANIVMLGALTKIAPVAERSCVEQAIAASVPKNKVDMNMKAFAAGFDAVSAC